MTYTIHASGDISGAILFIIIALLVAAVGVGALIWEKRRRDALIALAHRLGLTFYKRDAFGIPAAYGDTRLCSQGHSKRAYNIIAGDFGGGDIRYFDYKYTVGSGKNSHTYYRSACALHLPYAFTGLIVRPESFLDKAAGLIGFDDIDLDHAEFNNRFFVKCQDKKFAYDVLNQRAMEFFLARRGITLEMRWNYLLMNYSKRLSLQEIEHLISDAAAFSCLLPHYLKKDRELTRAAPSGTPPGSGRGTSDRLSAGIKGIIPSRRRPSS